MGTIKELLVPLIKRSKNGELLELVELVSLSCILLSTSLCHNGVKKQRREPGKCSEIILKIGLVVGLETSHFSPLRLAFNVLLNDLLYHTVIQ